MKLCNETITVFNRRLNDETGYEEYYPAVIDGVSWYGGIATSVDNNGLNAADRFTIRIPVDANFHGRAYVDPIAYKNALSSDGLFTLQQGDVVVRAGIAAAPMTPAEIHSAYNDCFTIQGVTDNRRAPNAPHWRVVGS